MPNQPSKQPLDTLSAAARARLRASTQPRWLNPTLATLTHEPFSDPDWIFEPKLDGERCLIFKLGARVRVFTRNRKSLNETYPEVATRKAVPAHGCLERDHTPFSGDAGERHAHWTDPKLVANIAFTEWTQDGKLRHPSFLGLRHDKNPTDVRKESAR